MKLTFLRSLTILATLSLLAACGSPRTAVDPYADPGTPPPPTITDPTIATSGSIAASSKGEGLYDINVAGFALPEIAAAALGTASVDSLPPSAFTVVEDGVVKGMTVERIGTGGTRAAADVAFVFDTTGSMASGLAAVQASIVEFANYLEDGGLDVRVGAVTFGDSYDTQAADGTRGVSLRGDVPPGFDSGARPTFELSAEFEDFRTFIEGDRPRGGGDVPENGLGALEFAFEGLEWRTGAQRIMIFVTDVCQHSDVTFEAEFGSDAGSENWAPPAPDALMARLRGNGVVHVIAPNLTCATNLVNPASLAGVDGTGGQYFEWDKGVFDLSELPLAAAARGGYVITYRGTEGGEPKTVRVVIDDGGNVRGEFSILGDY